MKKSEFTENPAPVELEGTVLRICFDTEEVDQVINNGEEGQESETRKVYLAYVIRVSNPFTLEKVTKALLKEGFDEFKAVAVAAEALLTANEAGLLPGNALELARQMQIARISEYDASDAVNQFSYDGVPMWLDKDTRNGLIARLNAEKAVGKTTSTLWLGTQSFTITPDAGLQMLSALEVYASECYDKTAEHKAAIAALNDVDAIKSYDFTQGYPAHLEF